MILTDAGPLIALLDRGDPDHASCVRALDLVSLPLVTTWPAFTEAMYLLGASTGYGGQAALWELMESGRLEIVELTPESVGAAAASMKKYADRPMDLADATLVAAAEQLGDSRIFSIDSDFRFYRRKGGKAFTVIP